MRRIFLQRGVLTSFAVLAGFFPESLDELQRVAVLTSVQDALRLLPTILASRVQKLSFVLASPLEAYGLSEADRLYAHALFALKDAALGIILASSATGVSKLLQAARDHRRHLVQDMRNGRPAQSPAKPRSPKPLTLHSKPDTSTWVRVGGGDVLTRRPLSGGFVVRSSKVVSINPM